MATALARSIRTCLMRRSGDALLTICAARPEQPHERLTGAALHRAALVRGQALAGAFNPADGPLALVMPCGSLFVETMIGALYAGFTIAPLARPRPGPQADRFDAIIKDCRPAAILCTEGLAARLAEARPGAGGRDVPIVALASATDAVPDEALPDRAGGGGPERPAILQYTSGSTRAPRGVLLHGDAILANAALANRTWGMDESGTMLSWLPHFHDMGLMGGILYPLLAGGATALMDPLRMIQRPERWLQLIGELRATFSGGPAFAFAHCLESVSDAQCAALDLSSWRKAFCGAEPVPAALMAAFRARFAGCGLDPRAVFASYGLAEHVLMVAGGTSERPEQRPPPPPGCEAIEPCCVAAEMHDRLRIVDPETRRPLPDNVIGEIWLRGDSVAGSYLGDPEETARVFHARLDDPGDPDAIGDDWLRTGDLGALRDGYLYVVGRLKDLLFVNGQKVPASDVEWLAGAQDPALNPMAAAALMPDELANGKGVLLIELRRRSHRIDEDLVRRRISRAVAGAWSIELTDIVFLAPNSLPRTTSGKVQRRLTAQAYRDDKLARTTPA